VLLLLLLLLQYHRPPLCIDEAAIIVLRLIPSFTHYAPSAILHTALPTPIAGSLAMGSAI
jgi:hypothetical protein